MLKEETARHLFLLEGNPGKAGDSFMFQKAALREKGK